MLILFYFVAIAVACFMSIRQRYFGSDEKENHENNKIIIGLRIGIMVFACAFLALFIHYSTVYEKDDPKMYLMIFIGLGLFLIGGLVSVKLDQMMGVSVCKQCCKKREPSYSEVLFSPHFFGSKYLRCPECKRRTWHRKEI